MPTPLQKQAIERNFTIFRLKGFIASLNNINNSVASQIIKEQTKICVEALEKLLTLYKEN